QLRSAVHAAGPAAAPGIRFAAQIRRRIDQQVLPQVEALALAIGAADERATEQGEIALLPRHATAAARLAARTHVREHAAAQPQFDVLLQHDVDDPARPLAVETRGRVRDDFDALDAVRRKLLEEDVQRLARHGRGPAIQVDLRIAAT